MSTTSRNPGKSTMDAIMPPPLPRLSNTPKRMVPDLTFHMLTHPEYLLSTHDVQVYDLGIGISMLGQPSAALGAPKICWLPTVA